ncbi:4Fe-4S cluster-binding domain-containing protein [Clostridium phoceensis]|uniref:4Fe-4S cluster-binding domain-containing protein n=1 Tax=Clostridium phoceensis TaxID=1650661 RepID=UPI0026DD648B|nr:4Fe-4S cluster-binding domain-containing protein [Clostridium phoceensis]
MICDLCPRRCGALRTEERGLGRCRMPELPVLARAALHRWEEPPISGTRGSGTIFFSGCSLGCVFCQNEEISHRDFGKAVTLERLARICGELVDQGAHNLNFVNPTHYAHVVGRLLEEHPQPVPVVWNSGGYDRVDTLRALEGKIQVYLPDLKYLDSDAAGRYSGASDYPQTAQAAIREMVRQTGPCAFDGDGLLTRGVVIRHLILPGQVSQAKAVMDWVAAEFGPGTVLFSLMSQYTPWGRSAEFPEIHRRLRAGEMRAAAEYMANLGLEGFTQERTSAQREYTPPFDLTGVAGEGGAL